MANRLLPLTITAKTNLKPVESKMRLKKIDVRQCRLCLRLLPRSDVRFTVEHDGYDFRRKISDAVGVRIKNHDKLQGVCGNCLHLVEVVNHFRESCNKANTIHRNRLLKMHPGKWTAEESKKTLADCHSLVKRHRAEMDALFKCFESKEEEDRQRRERKALADTASVPVNEIPERKDDFEQIDHMETEYLDVNQDDNSDIVSAQIEPINANQLEEAPTTDETNRAHESGKSTCKYMCELCGQMLKWGYIEFHYNKFHLHSTPYECTHPGCTKKYPSRITLNIHIKQVHKTPAAGTFECQICCKKIKGKKQFEFHQKTHITGEVHPDKSACPVCGKYFYKRDLRDHMFVHTGELPYSCEFCDRKYAAKCNWALHRRKHHADRLEGVLSITQ